MRWSIRMIDDEGSTAEDIANYPSDTPRQYIEEVLYRVMRTVSEGNPRIIGIGDFMECWTDNDDIIITASLG